MSTLAELLALLAALGLPCDRPHVIEVEGLTYPGLYRQSNAGHEIALRAGLSDPVRLRVAAHEFAHCAFAQAGIRRTWEEEEHAAQRLERFLVERVGGLRSAAACYGSCPGASALQGVAR